MNRDSAATGPVTFSGKEYELHFLFFVVFKVFPNNSKYNLMSLLIYIDIYICFKTGGLTSLILFPLLYLLTL